MMCGSCDVGHMMCGSCDVSHVMCAMLDAIKCGVMCCADLVEGKMMLRR